MDFIEQIFGLSPDGGNGLTETMFIVAMVAIAVLGVGYLRSRCARARSLSR
jgi:hypothetical protein